MSVLADRDIMRYVRSGRLKVEPFDPSLVQPGSIDLRLGHEIEILLGKGADTKDVKPGEGTKTIKVGRDGYALKPGRLALAKTYESLTLPDNLIGWLEGRSRFARLGLLVHVSSGFIHPGTEGRQTLELYNLSRGPIVLRSKIPLCQVIFEETKTPAKRAQGKVK